MDKSSNVLFNEMCDLWTEFAINHEKAANGNKAAAQRARKAIGSLKKVVTDYRKQSVEESKK